MSMLVHPDSGVTMTLNGSKGEPWFDDGNIILLTEEEPTAFRVHRGILARHSEIFQGMFSIPQPTSSDTSTTFDGCQIIRMYDIPSDLGNLITALYDGPAFRNESFEDFAYVAGILRLSTKYFITYLRSRTINFLAQTWPCTLQGHDEMVNRATTVPSMNGLTYPYVHPLHVLNLAKEVNVRCILPSVLYFLSLYPLADILRGDHPKLLVKHSSSPSSSLIPADIEAYTLMFQYRLKVILDFLHEDWPPALDCSSDYRACKRGLKRLAARLFTYWQTRTGPLHFIAQAKHAVGDETGLCEPCRMHFRQYAERLRERIWCELPSVIGLPDWQTLIQGDL